MRALILALTVLTVGVSAQTPPRQSPSIRVDAAAFVAHEAWDFNGSTEVLAGGIVGIDHRIWPSVALRAELLALRVAQRDADAWLRGFTVGARTRWGSGGWRPLLDVAVGLSHATTSVPPSGTRGNYLAVVGAGVERRLASVILGVTGRWLHASNNGRAGRHRNPDTQALGALVSVGWEH